MLLDDAGVTSFTNEDHQDWFETYGSSDTNIV